MIDIAGGIADAYNTALEPAGDAYHSVTPDTGPWLRDEDGNDVFQGGLIDEDPLWERTDANETVVQHDYVQTVTNAVDDTVTNATNPPWYIPVLVGVAILGVLSYVFGQLITFNIGGSA